MVIAGGGPAGIGLATALAAQGAAVLVIERTDYDDVRIGETLPPAIGPALALLGLDGALREGHLASFGIRSIWGSPVATDRSHLFDPYGNGWHVDRNRFDRALAAQATVLGATVVTVCHLTDCRPGWRLQLQGPAPHGDVRAQVLVDATGRRAALARRLGARRFTLDRAVAVIGVMSKLEEDRHGPEPVTLIETTEDGWWYSAPIPGGRTIATCLTDSDICRVKHLAHRDEWTGQLAGLPHTSIRAHHLILARPPVVIAAGNSRLDRPWGHRWMAVGDAAAALDPLAGDGILRAVTEAPAAAAAVLAACDGDENPLAAYAHRLETDFNRHLGRAAAFYQREQRWPTAPFWRRRHRRVSGP